MAKLIPNPITVAVKKLCAKSRKSTFSRLFLHVEKDYSAPEYVRDRAVFALTLSDDKNTHREVIEGIPGKIAAGYTSETVKRSGSFGGTVEEYYQPYAPVKGYWSLYACDNFPNMLETLPNDAEIFLIVSLDGGTSQLASKAGIHVDKLYLQAEWKRNGRTIVKKFDVDTEVSLHNSARFGGPVHDADRKGQAA